MRRLRRAALLAVASITVAACLPSRNNDADPSIRPTAVLSVSSSGFLPYGASGDDGDGDGCIDVADSFSPVVARAKCVHLSAVGSSDPQGTGTLEEFHFALVTTAATEFELLTPEQTIVSTEGTVNSAMSVVFRAPNLRQRAPGAYQARLEVVDRDGHSHVTLTPLTVENSRPIAVPPSPRFVTAWGAAWTTDGTLDFTVPRPITVHFSAGGSFDPDGDPLNYCWRDRTNQVELGCQTDPVIAVAPAPTSSSGKLVLELRVDDVFAVSQPVLATAVLDNEPGWAFENDTASIKVLDERRNSFEVNSGAPVNFREALAIDVVPVLGDSILYFKSDTQNTLARRKVRDMCADAACGAAVVLPPVNFPGVSRLTNVLHPAGLPFLWVVSVTNAGTTQVYALNPSTLATLASADTQGPFFTDDEAFAKVDRAGRLWAGSPFSSVGVTCFQYSSTPSPAVTECGSIPIDAGFLLTGLALRDVGGAGQEVWAMQSRNFLEGVLGDPSAKVLTTLGTVETISVNSDEIPFDADIAFSLEFVDSNLSWLNLFGEGIASVELCNPLLATPPGNGPIEAGTQLCIRSVAPFEASFETLSDSATGTFVALGLEGHSINRVTLGGQPTQVASPERIETLLTVDSTSGVWSVIENGNGLFYLSRGRGSGKNGVILSTAVGTTFVEPVLDAGSGDIWISTLFPPGAARHAPDGSRSDVVTAVRGVDAVGNFVGEAVQIVLPGGVLPDPQRGQVWLIGSIAPETGGGTQIFLFNPDAPRKRSAPFVALGVRGLPVPLVDSGKMAVTGESVVNAAVHVQSGDLIVMTATTAGLGSCSPVTVPKANYYLRRIRAANDGGAGFDSVPVCVVAGYQKTSGDEEIRFARDLSSGDVCVGFRLDPATVKLRRYDDGTTLESDGAVTASNGETLADIAADPKNCWLAGRGSFPAEAVWALLPSNVMRTLSAEDALGNPMAFPEASTIHPVVGLAEVRVQKAATKVWIGGGGGAPISLFSIPNTALPVRVDPAALPLQSDFEMTFVKH